VGKLTASAACLSVVVFAAGYHCHAGDLSVLPDSSTRLLFDAPKELEEGGGEFTVFVSVANVRRLSGYQIELGFYDNGVPTDAFTVVKSTEGKLFDGKDFLAGDLPGGRFSMLTAGDVSGSGVLAAFGVAYPPKLHGEFYIWLRAELTDSDADAVAWSCVPVAIQVGKDVSPSFTSGCVLNSLTVMPMRLPGVACRSPYKSARTYPQRFRPARCKARKP